MVTTLHLRPAARKAITWAALSCALLAAPVVGTAIAGRTERADASTARLASVTSPLPAAPPAVANDFPGVLLPPQMANLSPRADGRVLEVRAKVGQHVQHGDVIVVFDPRQQRHDLAMAEAQLKVARAEAYGAVSDSAAARKRAIRRDATVDVGGKKIPLVSGEEAAQSKFEAQSASARAASASAHVAEQQAKVEQLRLSLEESEVHAPYDGVVTGLYFEPGMTAHPGDVVARVVGGKGLRARIAVAEEGVELLKLRRARLVFEGKTLFATIDQVTPEVEPSSRAFLIEGSVDLDDASCAGDCAMLAGRVVHASLEAEGL